MGQWVMQDKDVHMVMQVHCVDAAFRIMSWMLVRVWNVMSPLSLG